ncbi:MAG: MBOAT family protein [Spirochaetes bacterium]|nr:MBOAT family protein [Spirochaetota bacterium]
MIFTSLKFLLFFPTVILIYFLLPYKWRYILLLIASYYFYMSWKPIYGLLLFVTTVTIYVTALLMENRSQPIKKFLVVISLLINLGLLFTFKYFNFFSKNMNDLFSVISLNLTTPYLEMLLPVGISFYTMQALSYTFDVYRGKIPAERNFGMVALFAGFFPTILCGPIERAPNLIPQFRKKFDFDYDRVTYGLKLMAWGFFKKLVIADRLITYSIKVLGNPQSNEGIVFLIALYFTAFQVFCDFSGYSDIAIGAAKVMGYDLMENFRRPFHSKSMPEFWQRWHISLISWLRDYLYIPLGGNRIAKPRFAFNILLIFFLSGLWHGAEWTFVVWAVLNGLFSVIGAFINNIKTKARENIFGAIKNSPVPLLFAAGLIPVLTAVFSHEIGLSATGDFTVYKFLVVFIGSYFITISIMKLIKENAMTWFVDKSKIMFRIFITFHLFIFAGVFFVVKSVNDAWYVLTHVLDFSTKNFRAGFSKTEFNYMIISILILELYHIIETRGDVFKMLSTKPAAVRWAVYILLINLILFLGVFGEKQFVYFKF